jgi:hypothetical protein
MSKRRIKYKIEVTPPENFFDNIKVNNTYSFGGKMYKYNVNELGLMILDKIENFYNIEFYGLQFDIKSMSYVVLADANCLENCLNSEIKKALQEIIEIKIKPFDKEKGIVEVGYINIYNILETLFGFHNIEMCISSDYKIITIIEFDPDNDYIYRTEEDYNKNGRYIIDLIDNETFAKNTFSGKNYIFGKSKYNIPTIMFQKKGK